MKTVAEWEQKRTIRYRQTISLWCWGYSYAAIASILGCTRQWCQQQIAPSVGMKRAVRARAQNRCASIAAYGRSPPVTTSIT